MLLTISNLPSQTRYVDVKSLIHSKCGFKDVILDNLTSDSNNTKKVTVGLAEEEDAAILMRKINGLFVDGQQLYVTTIKKKAPSAVMDLVGNHQQQLLQQPMLQQPYYQQSNQPNYEQGYSDLQQSRAQAMLASSMAFGGMYGAAQNASANYGYPQQMQHYQSSPQQLMAQSMPGYEPAAPLGFSQQTPGVWSGTNDWNLAGNSAGNQVTQQAKTGSRWDNTGDSGSRPRRDAPARDSARDRPSRFGPDPSPRDSGRNASRRDVGRDAAARDRGRDAPREQGRDRVWDESRDQGHGRGWNAPRDLAREHGLDAPRNQGRDRGFDAPRDQERVRVWEAPRDQGRDRDEGRDRNHGRDRGRDEGARARGRDHARDNRRPDPPRGPTKRQLSPPPSLFGAHAQNSAPHMRTFSQQRDGPKNYAPKQTWKVQNKAESNYVPPNKRSKNQGGVGQYPDKPKAKVSAPTILNQSSSKKNKPDSLQRLQARTNTWRAQIASLIGKEMMSNPKYSADDTPPEQLLTWLKRGIRNRLDLLFGDDLEILQPVMLEIYKKKFDPNNDMEFFNQVKEDVKSSSDPEHPANIDYAIAGDNPPAPQAKNKPALVGNVPSAPQIKNKPVSVGNIPPAPQAKKPTPGGNVTPAPQAKKKPPVFEAPGTIPSYPHGDKRGSKVEKKSNAALFEHEDVLLSQMNAKKRQALVEEIDAMGPLIASEFENETDAEMKKVFNKPKAKIIEDFKKMMKINLAKRMLNIGPIMIRIFTEPKVISRGKLAPILAKLGVTSLRKSQMKKKSGYFGTCNNYNVHDKLCNMKPITVDCSTVIIKPFQMTGKPEKPKRGQNAANEDDDFDGGDMADDFDEEADEDGNNLNTDDQSNIQDQKDDAGENGNAETNEQEEDQEIDFAADEDTNGNIKMDGDQENNDNDNSENVQLPESENAETESSVNAEKDANTKENEGGTEETNADENLDFTADVDINADSGNTGAFEIEVPTDPAEKDIAGDNVEDLEDKQNSIIDEIDMEDVDEDDLEDWC